MVIAKLKNGESLYGDLWTWRPREGWFSLVDSEKILLSDVESAVDKGVRVAPGVTADVDLLERARLEGWTG